MGNPDFNGKKFDYWSDENYEIFGVWNNDMKAHQYIAEWNGTIAPNKEEAIRKAKELNNEIK
jgi:hypothetical protein